MKNKYNKKYEVSYNANINDNSYTVYFEKIYLYPDETETDLINKIENKIRYSASNTYYKYNEIKI